jgi:hypothetical protein
MKVEAYTRRARTLDERLNLRQMKAVSFRSTISGYPAHPRVSTLLSAAPLPYLG